MILPVSHPRAVAVRVLVSLSLLAACGVAFRVSLKPLPPVRLASHVVSEDMNGVTAAQITLDTRIGAVRVQAGRPRTLTGEAELEGTLKETVSTANGVKTVQYTQRVDDPRRASMLFRAHSDRQRLDVNLPSALPIDLDVRGGFGETSLDLRGTGVESLSVRRGGEDLDLILPEHEVTARIDATFGETRVTGVDSSGTLDVRGEVGRITLDLRDAKATNVRAQTKFGDLDVSLPARFEAVLRTESGEAEIEVPEIRAASSLDVLSKFGDVTVRVPKDANVRVDAHMRFGDVVVPEGFERQGASYVHRGRGPLLIVRAESRQGDVTVREVEQ
ncbi:DUF4097 family beta strand repeat-containing protein [Deinococcus yavapaiensis]|uniref:Putative adhesin n=1 Tax=Deinococcus yavapaiensis KR-236 TaxID=694435 RepID=A0A318SEH2_9DEIO|nr:DUF4097 family beta strand repeat-containing protein [Deinococcus yavapaiensis]PYE55938.1 putative adhesin [Deinococcus yavapaiensis KR-236]